MLAILLSYLLLYKYLVLFLVTFLAAIMVPVPASATLMAAGAFASQGYLNLPYVFGIGFLGSVLGDAASYLISFAFGRKFLRRIGLKRVLNSKEFTALEEDFPKYAFSTIFFSRFLVSAIGPAINLISGLAKISARKFFLYEIPGEIIYVLLFAGLGYAFGNQWESIFDILENLSIIIVLAVLIGLLLAVKKFYWRRG